MSRLTPEGIEAGGQTIPYSALATDSTQARIAKLLRQDYDVRTEALDGRLALVGLLLTKNFRDPEEYKLIGTPQRDQREREEMQHAA